MLFGRREWMKSVGAGALSTGWLGETPHVFAEAANAKQAYSLHVGVDRLDPTVYGDDFPLLHGCVNDAKEMLKNAEKHHFTKSKLLQNVEGTWQRVAQYVLWAAEDLKKGDIFLLTYSGHGGQFPNSPGDREEDGYDETWCLYNGQLVDDFIFGMLSKFAPGVRVVIIADSCHSGTSTRNLLQMDLVQREIASFRESDKAKFRDLFGAKSDFSAVRSRAAALSAFQQSAGASGDSSVPAFSYRCLTQEIAHREYERNRAEYDRLRKSVGQEIRSENLNVRASVLLLAACQDEQLAQESEGQGLFTRSLLNVLDNSALNVGNYRTLLEETRKRMSQHQQPNFFPLGDASSPFYYSEKPFTV